MSAAAPSTPRIFPQTNSLGSRSLTSRRSNVPRSRSMVTLVTASAVMARRLATTIGTTAVAMPIRSGRGALAWATIPATAAAKSNNQAIRTASIARP